MIATLGDLIDDIVVWPGAPIRSGTDTPARIHRRRGGSAANVAAMVARCGGRARFIGSIGADAVGDRLTAELAADGVDVVVERVPGRPTGTIVVLVDPTSGERSFYTDRGACDALADLGPHWLDGVTALHVPLYSFVEEPLSAVATTLVLNARHRGIPVSVDASSTGAMSDLGLDVVGTLLRVLAPDVLLANGDEAALLRIGPERPAVGPALTVVKNGAAPTVVVDAHGGAELVAVPPVDEVVDTTGAGDGFAAGWLLARAVGATPTDAAVVGHAVAARVLRRPGADLDPTDLVLPTAAPSRGEPAP